MNDTEARWLDEYTWRRDTGASHDEYVAYAAAPGHAHARRIAQQARLHTGRWVRTGAMEVRLS